MKNRKIFRLFAQFKGKEAKEYYNIQANYANMDKLVTLSNKGGYENTIIDYKELCFWIINTFKISEKKPIIRDSRVKNKAIKLIQEATDPIVLQNCIELLERSKVGVEKYGTTLEEAGLSKNEIIQHAIEEALDLANYLRTLKSEL